MNAEEFLSLQNRLESLKQKHQRLIGSRDTLIRRLQDDFDCSSKKQAVAKLKKLQQEKDKLSKKYQLLIAEFKEKWEDKLDD